MRTRARVVVVIAFALLLLWLIWFTVSGFGAGLRGSGGIGEPTVVGTATPYGTVIESVDAPPVTLSEAFARIDRGQVHFVEVLPDSYADGARRWYGEPASDESLIPRWRVDGRDVLIDGTPILSANGQSMGLTADEWTQLLQRVSAHN